MSRSIKTGSDSAETSPARVARRADALANRQAILDAAIDVLSRNPHASLADVATHAGVVRRTVYAHYTSREELLAAVAASIGQQISERTAAIPDDEDPLVTIARFVHANSAAVAQLHNLGRVVDAPDVREALSAETAAVRARIRRLLEQAHQDGRTGPVPPAVGMRLAVAIQWSVFEAVAAGELAAEQAPDTAVRCVLGAAGVTEPDLGEIIAHLTS